jgi:hypothetical protein
VIPGSAGPTSGACSACGEPAGATDRFCEACGAELPLLSVSDARPTLAICTSGRCPYDKQHHLPRHPGVQNAQIWTVSVLIGLQPTPVHNGGYSRGYQGNFVPLPPSAVSATTVNQPYIYTSQRFR